MKKKLTGNQAIGLAQKSGKVNVTTSHSNMVRLTSKDGLPGVFYVKRGNNTLDAQTALKLMKILAYLGVSLLCIFLIFWPFIRPYLA